MKRPFRQRITEEFEDLAIEFIQLLGFMLSLYLGELLARYFFHDALIFGKFPKEYLFDAGDIALVSCFIYRACRRLLR